MNKTRPKENSLGRINVFFFFFLQIVYFSELVYRFCNTSVFGLYLEASEHKELISLIEVVMDFFQTPLFG